MLGRLLLLGSIETAYALVTRLCFPRYFSGIELELYTTAARLLTIPLYWSLFRPLIHRRSLQREAVRMPSLHFGIAALLLVPVVFGNDDRPGFTIRVVFALTSFVVGLREELVYRAILQNLLEEKLGRFGAILLASTIFALYHYGSESALNYSLQRFLELFVFGCIFGLIYRISGSLLLVAILHSILDLIYAISPVVHRPFSRAGEGWSEVAVLLIFLGWARECWRLAPKQSLLDQ